MFARAIDPDTTGLDLQGGSFTGSMNTFNFLQNCCQNPCVPNMQQMYMSSTPAYSKQYCNLRLLHHVYVVCTYVLHIYQLKTPVHMLQLHTDARTHKTKNATTHATHTHVHIDRNSPSTIYMLPCNATPHNTALLLSFPCFDQKLLI